MPKTKSKTDVSQLQRKIDEIKRQIVEERKTNDRLRHDAETKIQELKKLDKDMTLEREIFSKKKDELASKRKDVQNDHHVKLQTIKREQQECLEELSRYEISRQQHDKLEERLRKIAAEYYSEDSKMSERVEMRRRQAFELKMQMDQMFRKTLASIEANYQEKATEIVEQEAARAKEEVKNLKKTSDSREKEIVAIIRKQQESYDKMVKEKVNLDVLKTTTLMQEQLSFKMLDATKAIELEIQQALGRLEGLIHEAYVLSDHDTLAKTISIDLNQAIIYRANLEVSVNDAERKCSDMVGHILEETQKIEEFCQAAKRDELCEKFTDIVEMEVRRKEGEALIIERGKSKAALHRNDSQGVIDQEVLDKLISPEQDSFDYDAVWRVKPHREGVIEESRLSRNDKSRLLRSRQSTALSQNKSNIASFSMMR